MGKVLPGQVERWRPAAAAGPETQGQRAGTLECDLQSGASRPLDMQAPLCAREVRISVGDVSLLLHRRAQRERKREENRRTGDHQEGSGEEYPCFRVRPLDGLQ